MSATKTTTKLHVSEQRTWEWTNQTFQNLCVVETCTLKTTSVNVWILWFNCAKMRNISIIYMKFFKMDKSSKYRTPPKLCLHHSKQNLSTCFIMIGKIFFSQNLSFPFFSRGTTSVANWACLFFAFYVSYQMCFFSIVYGW